jgi:phosphoenolpyruvate synthase/pyruvate phosphate dikinase
MQKALILTGLPKCITLHVFQLLILHCLIIRDVNSLAQRLEMDYFTVKTRVNNRQESNPMLGFRGCRISIVHPEITEMQV